MKAQNAFGAAFLAALLFLAYCIFVLQPDRLDMAASDNSAICRYVG